MAHGRSSGSSLAGALLAGALASLLGCAASDEEGMAGAREVSWQRPEGEELEQPEAPSIEPQVIRTQPKPVTPPWKGQRVRALASDPQAAAKVRQALASLEGDPEVELARRRARERRRGGRRLAREAARDALSRIEAGELRRRRALEADLAARRSDHHAELRVRVYLTSARDQARGRPTSEVFHVVRALAESARMRLRACRQLEQEAAREVDRSRRFAQASLEQGIPVPGCQRDLREALRRHTEILLILEEAKDEAGYAQEAASRVDFWDGADQRSARR